MRRNYICLFAFCLLSAAILLCGCGGGDGPGSPGSCGTEKTGVMVDVAIVPTYLGANTYSVDAFRAICNPDADPPVIEYFATHDATFTFTARLINPNTDFRPGRLHIEKYTIKYFRSTDSIGAPPIETDRRFMTLAITPPTGSNVTTLSTTGIFVDLKRKYQYWDDIFSGRYTADWLNNYTAVYRFEGKNDFGDSFCFEGQANFEIANFDNCGG